jgi:deferrochelatase/peroxidase EfeB
MGNQQKSQGKERPRTGTSPETLAQAILSPDAERLEAVLAGARDALRDVPGVAPIWKQDTYMLPNERTSFGFKDGISHPAIEGSGIPGSNPHEKPFKAGESASSCVTPITRPWSVIYNWWTRICGRRCGYWRTSRVLQTSLL